MSENKLKKDPEIPWTDVLMFAGAIAYFVLPTDLIPDALPGVGFSDDLAALTMAFKKAKSILSSGAFGEATKKASELLGDTFSEEDAAKLAMKLNHRK